MNPLPLLQLAGVLFAEVDVPAVLEALKRDPEVVAVVQRELTTRRARRMEAAEARRYDRQVARALRGLQRAMGARVNREGKVCAAILRLQVLEVHWSDVEALGVYVDRMREDIHTRDIL